MKRFFLKAMLFLLPLVFIPIVNYISDPAGFFHGAGHTEKMAKAILAGQTPYFSSGNGDERMVKHHLIINMPNNVDCVSIGTSFVMCIRHEMTGAKTFYNLGESGADIYDILAQFATMRLHNKKIARVIFSIDLYSFDETQYTNHTLNIPLKQFANYMIKYLKNEKLNSPRINSLKKVRLQIKNLFSLTYFFDSIKNQWRGWGIADENFTGAYYMPDASWVYSQEFQSGTTVEYVRKHSENYNINYYFTPNVHVSEFSKDIFEKLINYLITQNIEVELFMCPLAPSLYDRLDFKKHFILPELEGYVYYLQKKYNLKITGNYNPYKLNMTDADFYDARHVRAECLPKYFDFTKNSQQQ